MHGSELSGRSLAASACLHQAFEEQARRTPEAVALSFGDERVTYAQLNHRANQLARHLQKLGVKAETPVALCLERSVEMLVAILGVLKAGERTCRLTWRIRRNAWRSCWQTRKR